MGRVAISTFVRRLEYIKKRSTGGSNHRHYHRSQMMRAAIQAWFNFSKLKKRRNVSATRLTEIKEANLPNIGGAVTKYANGCASRVYHRDRSRQHRERMIEIFGDKLEVMVLCEASTFYYRLRFFFFLKNGLACSAF